jgi:hypothetical protein
MGLVNVIQRTNRVHALARLIFGRALLLGLVPGGWSFRREMPVS